jgi:hypothetical protein
MTASSRHYLLITLCIVSTALLLADCSDTAGPNAGGVFVPGVGSSYMLASYDVDRSGAKIAGSDDTSSITVAATGVTRFGRNDVVLLTTDWGDTTEAIYESNGDLSITSQHAIGGNGVIFTTPLIWTALPFGSKKGETTVMSYDSSATVAGVLHRLTLTETVAYVGSEEVQVGSQKLSAQKVVQRVNWVHSEGASSDSVVYIDTLSFAPSIGFFAAEGGSRTSSQSPPFAGWRTRLVSYSLK